MTNYEDEHHDTVRKRLDDFINEPIDDLSVEELVKRRELLIEIEEFAIKRRRDAGRQVEWLVFGKKDRRRTKFQYWDDSGVSMDFEPLSAEEFSRLLEVTQ